MCFPAIAARTSTQICMAIATLIAFLDFTANSSRDVISCHGCHSSSWDFGGTVDRAIHTCRHLLGLSTCLCWGRSAPLCDILACVFMSFMISFSLVNSFDIFECPESRALLEAFQWSELLLIFLVQAAADIESRALLALIIVSLCLDCIRIVFKTTPAPPDLPILYISIYNLRSLGFHFYRPISIAIAARSQLLHFGHFTQDRGSASF